MRQIFLALAFAFAMYSCSDNKSAEAQPAPMVKEATSVPPAEFADETFVTAGKANLKLFEEGKVEEWAQIFSDNAVYNFSGGDSLAGKQAIIDYWKKRRNDAIETIRFSDDIWLPIKVNQPQKGPDMPGVWLMAWYRVDVKYKTGKAIAFWTHQDFHFNDEGKIDRAIQYLDRAPINAALGIK